MDRFLLVNGDDFGLSPGINGGIIEAYREGILTSASLMATGGAFEEAIVLARESPGLSVGVHLTLAEGVPILPQEKIPTLVTANGRFFESWTTFLVRWLAGRIRIEEIQHELEAQVERVLAHGIRIDKLDSHMHLHLLPGILRIVITLAWKYRIRGLRLVREAVGDWHSFASTSGFIKPALLTLLSRLQARKIVTAGLIAPDHFSGVTHSGELTEDRVLPLLEGLQPGVTELMTHPGYQDALLESWPRSRQYSRERELRALTSPQVKARVRELGIKCVSYSELALRELR